MCKILSRINEIATREGITITALERCIGASRGVISKAIKNSTDIQSKWLVLICENFPQYSAHWLLTGNGNMLSTAHLPHNESKPKSEITQMAPYQGYSTRMPGSIPLVSEKAVGGIINEYFSINEDDVLGYYVIPKFRHLGVDFMIEVSGDSMVPRFYPGDIVACSILHNPKFIQWNKSHLLATAEQGLILKRLMPSTDSECLQAVSENKDYPPFLIPKEEIKGIALVVGSIHIE